MSTCTFPVLAQNTSKRMVNQFGKGYFNSTVCMEFQVCFTFAKYENDMLLICDTTNVFINAFLQFQNPFSSVRSV